MMRSRQAHWWPVVFVAGQIWIFPLPAPDSTPATPAAKSFSAVTNGLPPLMPLLHESPTNRAARLAQIPGDVRELVQSRLEEWSILPPTLQQEFLENEHILQYFAHVETSSRPAENAWREPSENERAHWNGLSEPERRQVAAGFNQFFDLTPVEKEKALNTLSETERRQMEKTLQSFEKMPPSQRDECVNAFARFASMNAPEQAEFLKNAERWSALTPAERQAWRDLVVNVPQWPPL